MIKLLGYIWSLPNTLLGLLLCLVYWPTGARWVEGCLELRAHHKMIGDPSGQTWGCVIWYSPRTYPMDTLGKKSVRVHEQVHVHQSMVGGVFFLLAYAACFLFYWGLTGMGSWQDAYFKIPFEVSAYLKQAEWLKAQSRGN